MSNTATRLPIPANPERFQSELEYSNDNLCQITDITPSTD